MRTRSLTMVIQDSVGAPSEVCVLYRQYDGNASGHARALKEFLTGMTITRVPSQTPGRFANGAGCLAAQLVAHFKTEPCGVYLYPAGTRDCGENYTYLVTAKVGAELRVKVIGEETIYDGPVSGFDPDVIE